jgi:hypothetical protein
MGWARPTDEEAAHHEAGHAVVALYLGGQVARVYLLDSDQQPGGCDLTPPAACRYVLCYMCGLIAAAGAPAGQAFMGAQPAVGSAASDLRPLYCAAKHLCHGDWDAEGLMASAMRLRAAEIVARAAVWRRIQAVAPVLVQRRTLTGDEVRAIVAGVQGSGAGSPSGSSSSG